MRPIEETALLSAGDRLISPVTWRLYMNIILGSTHYLQNFPAYETTKFDYIGKHFEVYVDWEDKTFTIWVWETTGGCGYRQVKSDVLTPDMINKTFDCYMVHFSACGRWLLDFDDCLHATTEFASSLLEDTCVSAEEYPIHVEHNLRHLA